MSFASTSAPFCLRRNCRQLALPFSAQMCRAVLPLLLLPAVAAADHPAGEVLPTDVAVDVTPAGFDALGAIAADLIPAYEGPALGARLAALEARWIASGFTLTREALLESPPDDA